MKLSVGLGGRIEGDDVVRAVIADDAPEATAEIARVDDGVSAGVRGQDASIHSYTDCRAHEPARIDGIDAHIVSGRGSHCVIELSQPRAGAFRSKLLGHGRSDHTDDGPDAITEPRRTANRTSPWLRKESVERLRKIRERDIEALGVVTELELNSAGVYVQVAPSRNLNEERGVRVDGTRVQFGLDEDEIERLEDRIEELLDDVDRGKIAVR